MKREARRREGATRAAEVPRVRVPRTLRMSARRVSRERRGRLDSPATTTWSPIAILSSTFQSSPFRAAAWLPGAHAQTIAGRFLRRPTGVHYRRERLETEDGDFVDLDHATVGDLPVAATAPLVVVVHGLEGSSRSSYVLETCRALAEQGMRSVALNFRSCSGENNRTARFYHAGDTGDFRFVLKRLVEREPAATLGAVGYSLGGNMLLKYLGEEGGSSPFRAAVATSVPFDLMAGSRHLDATRMGRFYSRVFLRSLRAKYHAKRDVIGDACDDARVMASRSFVEFDDAATAPLHGFTGVEDYYGRSSSAGFLHAIRVPTLLIQSTDDPFVPPSAIPGDAIEANPCLTLSLTDRGGHVGFIAGSPWAPRFWAEREAARYLADRLG
jgi:uncharacterized protein